MGCNRPGAPWLCLAVPGRYRPLDPSGPAAPANPNPAALTQPVCQPGKMANLRGINLKANSKSDVIPSCRHETVIFDEFLVVGGCMPAHQGRQTVAPLDEDAIAIFVIQVKRSVERFYGLGSGPNLQHNRKAKWLLLDLANIRRTRTCSPAAHAAR